MADDSFMRNFLDQRKNSGLLRELKDFEEISALQVNINGRQLLNFSSNDYLGLATDLTLKRASEEAVKDHGTGSTASRLISGNNSLFSKLEVKLASWKGSEDALVFNSGYQANSTIIPAIADRNTTIFSDKLNHASIIDGILLSRADHVRYRHNDNGHLEELLKKSNSKKKIIISETLFSMDGDLADFKALVQLKEKYNAFLYLDDAHGSGIYGPSGRGPAEAIMNSVDFYIGTFGKALGSFGAYCACSSLTKKYLVNSARGLIYSTALPPAIIAASIAAIDKAQKMDDARKHLKDLTMKFRSWLKSSEFETIDSDSPIVPLITGDEKSTLSLSNYLMENEIFAIAIRPPTVPKGKGRIRFTITAAHTDEHIEHLISVLNSWK